MNQWVAAQYGWGNLSAMKSADRDGKGNVRLWGTNGVECGVWCVAWAEATRLCVAPPPVSAQVDGLPLVELLAQRSDALILLSRAFMPGHLDSAARMAMDKHM